MTNDTESTQWDRVSESYTENCTPLSQVHATDAVAALYPRLSTSGGSPFTILDIGCGGGAFALSYFQCFPRGVPGHRLILTDISPGMVAEAERSLAKARLIDTDTVVEFRTADATDLGAFTDASVDAVSIIFGVFLIPNRVHVLAEIRRVLKPAGAFVTTSWTTTPTPLPKEFGYDFEQVTLAGAKAVMDSPEKGEGEEEEGDWDECGHDEDAHAMMQDGGFKNVAIWKTIHSVPFNGPKHVWGVILSSPYLDLRSCSDVEVQQKYLKFKEQMFPDHDDSKHSMILLTSASNVIYGTT